MFTNVNIHIHTHRDIGRACVNEQSYIPGVNEPSYLPGVNEPSYIPGDNVSVVVKDAFMFKHYTNRLHKQFLI